MPMDLFRLARKPSGAVVRAVEMLNETESLANSTLFALEVAGMDPRARAHLAEAIDQIFQARQITAEGFEQ